MQAYFQRLAQRVESAAQPAAPAARPRGTFALEQQHEVVADAAVPLHHDRGSEAHALPLHAEAHRVAAIDRADLSAVPTPVPRAPAAEPRAVSVGEPPHPMAGPTLQAADARDEPAVGPSRMGLGSQPVATAAQSRAKVPDQAAAVAQAPAATQGQPTDATAQSLPEPRPAKILPEPSAHTADAGVIVSDEARQSVQRMPRQAGEPTVQSQPIAAEPVHEAPLALATAGTRRAAAPSAAAPAPEVQVHIGSIRLLLRGPAPAPAAASPRPAIARDTAISAARHHLRSQGDPWR